MYNPANSTFSSYKVMFHWVLTTRTCLRNVGKSSHRTLKAFSCLPSCPKRAFESFYVMVTLIMVCSYAAWWNYIVTAYWKYMNSVMRKNKMPPERCVSDFQHDEISPRTFVVEKGCIQYIYKARGTCWRWITHRSQKCITKHRCGTTASYPMKYMGSFKPRADGWVFYLYQNYK